MLPFSKMSDEDLETVTGGMTPNLFIGKTPIVPITGEPVKDETPEILIFFP